MGNSISQILKEAWTEVLSVLAAAADSGVHAQEHCSAASRSIRHSLNGRKKARRGATGLLKPDRQGDGSIRARRRRANWFIVADVESLGLGKRSLRPPP
jgi:hypothetical protein